MRNYDTGELSQEAHDIVKLTHRQLNSSPMNARQKFFNDHLNRMIAMNEIDDNFSLESSSVLFVNSFKDQSKIGFGGPKADSFPPDLDGDALFADLDVSIQENKAAKELNSPKLGIEL